MGQGYLNTGRPELALPLFLKFEESFPYAGHNLYHLAACYRDLKEYAKAEAVLDRALRIYPRAGPPWDVLGQVQGMQGKEKEALASYHKSALYAPENAGFQYNHGV